MLRITDGAPSRAVVTIAAVLAIALAVVALVAAQPARAAASDPLATAADQSLIDMRSSRVQHVAAALAGGAGIDTTQGDLAYRTDLGIVAEIVASRTDTPAGAFVQAWTAATPARMTVMLSALSEVGVRYQSRASDPGVGFDCSGLTMFAWAQSGVALPHQDRSQMNASAPRTWESAEPADLVQYPGHVMLYLGAGQAIVHAPNTGSVVRVQEVGGRSVRLASPLG